MNTITGIASIIAGTAINNFGIFLQKRQVNIIKTRQGLRAGIGFYFRDPLWVLGILMQTLLCMPFIIFSIELIGITLAQPLANAGVVFLVFFLVFFLDEKLGKADYAAIFLLVTGVIALGLGGVEGEIHTDSFMGGGQGAFKGGLLIMGFLFLLNLLLLKSLFFKRYALGFLGGLSFSFVSVSMQIFSTALFEYFSAGGGTYLLLPILLSPVFFIAFTACGILSVQEAFKSGQAVNIIPFIQIPLNLIPVIAGTVIFGQSIERPVVFTAGLALVIISASVLAGFQGDNSETA